MHGGRPTASAHVELALRGSARRVPAHFVAARCARDGMARARPDPHCTDDARSVRHPISAASTPRAAQLSRQRRYAPLQLLPTQVPRARFSTGVLWQAHKELSAPSTSVQSKARRSSSSSAHQCACSSNRALDLKCAASSHEVRDLRVRPPAPPDRSAYHRFRVVAGVPQRGPRSVGFLAAYLREVPTFRRPEARQVRCGLVDACSARAVCSRGFVAIAALPADEHSSAPQLRCAPRVGCKCVLTRSRA